MQYIYPKFYSLHDMPDDAGLADERTGMIVLPPAINLSSASLVPYGLYLIDDGQTQFLWVGREAVPQLIEDVFDIPDRSQLKVGKQTLPVLENDFNERVRAVVEKSRDHKSSGVGSIIVPHLYVVREDGEPGMRLWAQTMLVEDRADQGVSLKQWLGMMREKVRRFIPSMNLQQLTNWFLRSYSDSTLISGIISSFLRTQMNRQYPEFPSLRPCDMSCAFVFSFPPVQDFKYGRTAKTGAD